MINRIQPYFLWISLTIFYNFVVCWWAVKCPPYQFWKMYAGITLAMLIPTWSLAAYFSKNLIFDALLFDSILVFSSPFILGWLGQASNFSWYNWTGVALAVGGLILVRVGH